MIIGLSGYARSGKDTAAEGLHIFGFTRVAFADKLREFLYLLNPAVFPAKYVPNSPVEETQAKTVQWVIDQYGWDNYKNSAWGPGIRELLQRLGTECGREMLYDTVWVDAALDDYRTGKIKHQVVPDVRFPNEAEAIKELGGYVLRIERPGVGPANDHPSEHALADWVFDAVIDNDGTVDELHLKMSNTALAFAL